MKISIKALEFTTKLVEDKKKPDLLAYMSLKFIDEHERHFTVNGFTIRKSKFDSKPYLAGPSKSAGGRFFKFILAEKSLWKEIEKEAVREYEEATIPVIN